MTIYCVFDTETIGQSNRQVYDLAGILYDSKTDSIIESFECRILESLLIPYAHNESFHSKHFENSKCFESILPFNSAIAELKETVTSKADIITAFNLPFDLSALRSTADRIGYDKFALWPNNAKFQCLMSLSIGNLCQSRYYYNHCMETNSITESGNLRHNAETIVSYCMGGMPFETAHTALADSKNQLIILKALIDINAI